MNTPKVFNRFLILIVCLTSLCSCNKELKASDYTAYFGGEIVNPTHRYVLFCKDSQVLDTIPLKEDNTFFIKFDSLASGLYNFKHEPEYQYVFFDKNDSIMVHINSNDFDESIVFCGKGDEKNNFLMDLYLRNESNREQSFDIYDYDVSQFSKNIDSTYSSNKKFYDFRKSEIKWSNDFDLFAKASLDFHNYSKKELYPVIHKMRTGNDIRKKLPKDFYSFRKNINFNNVELTGYLPFVMYLSHLLNNLGSINYHNHFSEVDLSLKINVNKLNIADTLIKNEKVKNMILNNIAFTYFLEDQNMLNNQTFLDTYHKYSTDKSAENEIIKIGKAIQLLKPGNSIPEVNLINLKGQKISSKNILAKKTILFFYTENAETHMASAHKKAIAFKSRHPDYQFIAINLDEKQSKWFELLSKYKFDGIEEYRCDDFEDLKTKWAITKIHRTIILDKNGKINNAFTNLFEANFEKYLK
ncbi:thioredoxin-like domain-containing protein [Flavobacterium sp.]|uniref:TlpA family protein disulfide reductase n=1 Tax=Flavobacterium sp. TaxID=239 RepID=UPI00286B9B15|nr:thioredoxin-like domain-containing protein [Flavobacterium sp.]